MTSGDDQLDALLTHMREPLPVGHGMHDDSIDTSNVPFTVIKQHQWEHHFSDKVTHTHKRPGDEDE